MAESPDYRVLDTGVAWIRTRLAWGRTLLTLSVTAVLAARFGVRHGAAGAAFAGVSLAGLVAAALWALVRIRQLSGRAQPVSAVTPRMLVGAALIAPGYAILGLVMLFTL